MCVFLFVSIYSIYLLKKELTFGNPKVTKMLNVTTIVDKINTNLEEKLSANWETVSEKVQDILTYSPYE